MLILVPSIGPMRRLAITDSGNILTERYIPADRIF